MGLFFFFQAEDGIRDYKVTGVQTCALPICDPRRQRVRGGRRRILPERPHGRHAAARRGRSEEHTSELQSPCKLVCRPLLGKKKKNRTTYSVEAPTFSYTAHTLVMARRTLT